MLEFNCNSNNLFKIVKKYKIRRQYLKIILYQFVSGLTCKGLPLFEGLDGGGSDIHYSLKI